MTHWRSAAVVVATGLASGLMGAIFYAHLAKPMAQRPVAIATEAPELRAPLVPPGWDPRLVSRLTDVERKLDEVRSSAAVAPTSNEVAAGPLPEDPEGREQARVESYQKELAHLEKALADHAHEPIDDAWAKPLSASMQESLRTGFERLAQTKSVDCRSTTCTATLSFPTPSDALMALQNPRHLNVQGCAGLVAIPTPPTSAGPYDLTLVYNCR